MPAEAPQVPLYRIENPNIPPNPDGINSHIDLVGQWFSPNIGTATNYLRKSTQTFGREAKLVDGTQLVVAHLPKEQLERHHVSNHPVARSMDVERDNYILPRDGSIPMQVIELDGIIGDLKGSLGNFQKLSEAKKRIVVKLGELSTS
jgi:hypothetical protein